MLETLKTHSKEELPPPFPLSRQYAWADESDSDDDESEKPAPKKKPNSKKNNPKKTGSKKGAKVAKLPEKPSSGIVHEPHVYAQARKDFVSVCKARGMSHKAANEAWNNSMAKTHLLKDVSVTELQRRKFIAKGCRINPWAATV